MLPILVMIVHAEILVIALMEELKIVLLASVIALQDSLETSVIPEPV